MRTLTSSVQDPLASPNARSSTLDFSPARPRLGLTDSLRKRVKAAFGKVDVVESHVYPIQELSVWTPERVLWSLRFFTCACPSPASCVVLSKLTLVAPQALLAAGRPPVPLPHARELRPFCPVRRTRHPPGASLVCKTRKRALLSDLDASASQTFLLVHLYSTLVSDRASLQAEVMHEYNAKFVNPRVFAPKRDACVSTSQAEMVGADDWLRAGRRYAREESLGGADEDVVVRGSGRKVRRRESAVPSLSREGTSEVTDSPVPRRKSRSTMLA